jgi:uncharacterized protein
MRVLLLPGWHNSGPEHWQSRWERLHGYARVEQHDWTRPLRGDWLARLEDVLLTADSRDASHAKSSAEPVVLVAHSLGCLAVTAWAAHSRQTARVAAALLVAPPDLDREELREMLPGWSPVLLQKLPFPSVLITSHNDPFCRFERAQHFADAWGAQLIDAGPRGHLNADSSLGDWPEAHQTLEALIAEVTQPDRTEFRNLKESN